MKQKKVSAADGEEVPAEAIVKGYELASGEYVTVGDDELAALDPEAAAPIDIEEFVDLDEIDPLFYDCAYYLAPDQATVEAVRAAGAGDGEVGQGRHRPVRDAHQAVPRRRASQGRQLLMSTMVYADELNDVDRDPRAGRARRTSRCPTKELDMARSSSHSLSADFEPERFEDTYRQQVLELIERKAAGHTEVVAPPVVMAADKVVDLMAALEASVQAAKAARQRHPAGAEDDAGGRRRPRRRPRPRRPASRA